MRVSIRLLASVAVIQLSVLTAHADEGPVGPPQAATLENFTPPSKAMGDLEQLPLIFKAYRDNDLTEAAVLKSKLSDPAAQAVA
jgi:soluble lytic murein transglycosylase